MKFTQLIKRRLVVLITIQIFLGVLLNLIIEIYGKEIFEKLKLSVNPIFIMLFIILFVISIFVILILVEYFQKEEEHKIYKEDTPPDESVPPAPKDPKPIETFPRRKAIVSIGLVFSGFTAAFIVRTIVDNFVKPPAPIPPIPTATPTPLNVLKFASLPTIDFTTKEEKENWDRFIRDMEQTLGISVQIFPVQTYKDVIKAINSGDAQIAWFGGKSYVEAAKKNKIEAFAQTVNDDGSRGYYSYLIANKDNPISQVEVRDKNQTDKYLIDKINQDSSLKFAFNDKNSTSGFLIPNLCFFAKNGIEAKKIFREPLQELRNHEATALAVADKRVDIATNNSEALIRLKKNYPQDHQKIEVIWKSRIIPSDPIAFRKDLPEYLKRNIREFFYKYENETVLNIMGWSRFEPASDSKWDIVRRFDNIAEQIRNGTSYSKLQAEAQRICSPQ